MYVPVLILSLSAGVSETITAPPSSAITDLIEWLRVVNDSSASFDDRVAAEKALVNTNDATVIEPLFNILDEPIGDRWTRTYPETCFALCNISSHDDETHGRAIGLDM